MREKERLDRLALALLAEPGDARLADLLADHPPDRVLAACRTGEPLGGSGLPEPWRVRARAGAADRAADVLAGGLSRGLRWVCPGEREWPAGLDDLDHGEAVHGTRGAPVGIWLRGGGRLWRWSAPTVAIVGARAASTYGTSVAADLGADLTDAGVVVVSGAAFGIDAAAHRGALSMGGPTLAVLACGADVAYPAAHGGLLDRIAEDGVVLSEQAPREAPTKGRFLSRNRLIAALATGTVVVEAARRSGALSTLGWAESIGRVVMGVPGPVTSAASAGVHQALRDQRALVVTGADEVREVVSPLGTSLAPVVPVRRTAFDALPGPARAVLEAVPAGVSVAAATVATRAGCSAERALAVLADLERSGWVRADEGRWTLARRADLATSAD